MRFLVLLLSVFPLPAFALSCVPFGVSDAFLHAQQAEERYVPVLGKLRFDPALVPHVDWSKQTEVPQRTLIPATFEGAALGAGGMGQPFVADVVLEIGCAGPWCPAPEPGETLAFLRKTEHSYVLTMQACRAFGFGNPTKGQIKEAQDCLAGRGCDPWAKR